MELILKIIKGIFHILNQSNYQVFIVDFQIPIKQK
jgi:hypothetical protein